MNYLLTAIELHPDKGFGVTADAYYKSAEHLLQHPFEHYDMTQQAEMPQNYLYRHAIELYLKSLIIIFHRTLRIDYGNVPFDSDEPEMLSDGQWRKLYTCHFIDKLYAYWLDNLLLPHAEHLNTRAPLGEWIETPKVTSLFALLAQYDRDSSYFRYPITKNSSLDPKKYTMQKFKTGSVTDFMRDIQEGKDGDSKRSFTMFLLDDEENVVEAFRHAERVLPDVRDALKEVAFYFNCVHTMTRCTLCGGM